MTAQLIAASVTAPPPRRLDARELARRDTAAGPWTGDQRIALLVVSVVAFALIVAAYWSASGSGDEHHQVTWLKVSILGVIVAGGGNGLYLLRGYRNIRLARSAIFVPAGLETESAKTTSGAPGSLVFVAGTTRYHRPSCALVADKKISAQTLARHEKAGRTACEVCQP